MVGFLAGKACKTHEAVVNLAAAGYGQDAGILLRSLLNLVVNALWICEKPNPRLEMYLEYDWITRDALVGCYWGSLNCWV